MAASFKGNTKSQKLAKSFKDRLDKIGCPYTEGVDDSWITELIFKPGEPRIRLLQWLFSKFDSQLNDLLDPQYASVESKMDSRMQRLLFVGSTLGLCRYDDVDLIRGVTTGSKQAAFMDNLIDLVCIMDTAEDPQNKALRSPGVVSDEMSLYEQFTSDCNYMDTLMNQEKIGAIFNSRLTLLPADLQRQVEAAWADQGHTRENPPKVNVQNLIDSAENLAKDIQRQKEILEELQKKYEYEEEEISEKERVKKTLQLVLTELTHLVTNFSYLYENEMCLWCNKSPPFLSDLGTAFKRVHNLLQQFVAMLKGFQSIRHSYSNLSQEASMKLKRSGMKSQKDTSLASTGQAALESFQECVSVLDESIQRHDMVDESTNISFRSSILKV
ncbi:HAUS augmin-like complex subunit 7 [Mytilus californianus]|uniref:HAUS augmin-like complex subunit 7 n=1 Tax=Mytilus californianus TaxID=6549 RepID=UPI0022454A4A|nr:HAUS augmin-like complex subunit 7 [Mytilus californianus]